MTMMNTKQARAAMIKRARREIVDTLNVLYHIGPFPFPSICEALLHLQLPDDECVKRDLTYLCEKGYVEWANEAAYVPWDRREYKVTAKGNELAERMIKDPALEP